ncbi:hypothetical protein BD309DRAFT_1048250, partial [Dichomitus squalens]
GNISLRLATSINSAVSSQTTAKGIWGYLETTYSKPSMPAVYQDFRAALALSIPADLNPVPNLGKFKVYFQRLETNKFVITDHIKGIMLMAKLPCNMDPMIQLYIAGLKPATGKLRLRRSPLLGSASRSYSIGSSVKAARTNHAQVRTSSALSSARAPCHNQRAVPPDKQRQSLLVKGLVLRAKQPQVTQQEMMQKGEFPRLEGVVEGRAASYLQRRWGIDEKIKSEVLCLRLPTIYTNTVVHRPG